MMKKSIVLSHNVAKKVLMELLEQNDFIKDTEVMDKIGSITSKAHSFSDNGQLSRIIVDKDCRIYLPDYSENEVKMPYLPKTIFLFFLNHSEGVEFRKLRLHQDELYLIYQVVSANKKHRSQYDEALHHQFIQSIE